MTTTTTRTGQAVRDRIEDLIWHVLSDLKGQRQMRGDHGDAWLARQIADNILHHYGICERPLVEGS